MWLTCTAMVYMYINSANKSCYSWWFFFLDDVETHVKLLIEVVPEWLTVVEIKKGKYVKMDRNIELGTLQDKVLNMAKS